MTSATLPKRHRLTLFAGVAAGCLLGCGTLLADDKPDPKSLIAGVVANQRTKGLRARAKLVISPAGGRSRTVQLLIKGRREGKTGSTLVVAMWPGELKGQAWMLERRDGGTPRGFHFTPPDKLEKLDRGDFKSALFGSQFSVEDLAESFWEWPSQKLTGEERIGRADCWLIESRPSSSSRTVIRSWVAKDKPVPMRIEKLNPDGQTWKRIETKRVVKRSDGGWSAAELAVETAAGRTVLSGARSDRDIDLPASDFTPEGVKALTAGN